MNKIKSKLDLFKKDLNEFGIDDSKVNNMIPWQQKLKDTATFDLEMHHPFGVGIAPN